MKACDFPGSRTIGPPRTWDQGLDGECGSVFVTDQVDTLSGMNFMYSVYQPSAADLAALNAGGVIRLGIAGTAHPVFSLGVLGPETTIRAELEPVWDLGEPTA